MLIIALLAIVSFTLHLVWEFSHVSLYGGYQNLSPFLPMPVFASIGDVGYTLLAVLLVSIFKWGIKWISNAKLLDYVGLAVIGFFVAAFVEYKAMAFEKWYYLDTMPVIPGLEVGLSPVLQMVILLPLSVYITSLIIKLTSNHTTN